jgi:hypothetical protein
MKLRVLIVAVFAQFALACASEAPKEKTEAAAEGCHTPLGFIAEGTSATGYLHPIETNGQSCQQGALTCNDGVWSGAYIYPSCTITPAQ